jgi:hypothetical protein
LAWLGLAWLGLKWSVEWRGLAWLGLAWLGLAWLGLASVELASMAEHRTEGMPAIVLIEVRTWCRRVGYGRVKRKRLEWSSMRFEKV